METQEFSVSIKTLMDNSFEKSIKEIMSRLYRSQGNDSNMLNNEYIENFSSNLRKIIDAKIEAIIDRYQSDSENFSCEAFLKKLREYNDSTTDPGMIKIRVPYKDVYVAFYGKQSKNQVSGYLNDIMNNIMDRFKNAPESL